MQHCPRSLIFGGTATVEQYKGNPRVQAHGPGFSKIILGDDKVDEWEKYLDIMVDSVFVNSGRGCINCSGIWASRHGKKIAEAIAAKIGPVAAAAAGRSEVGPGRVHRAKGQADAINAQIDTDVKEAGVIDMTAKYGSRLVKKERCDYLRPTVIHCETPREGDRQEGIHVPVLHRGRVPAGEDARSDRPDAGLHRRSPRTRSSSAP